MSLGLFATFCHAAQYLPSSRREPVVGRLGRASARPATGRSAAPGRSPGASSARGSWMSMKLSRIRWYWTTLTPVPSWPDGDIAERRGRLRARRPGASSPGVLAFAMLWPVVSSERWSASRPRSAVSSPRKVERHALRPSRPRGRRDWGGASSSRPASSRPAGCPRARRSRWSTKDSSCRIRTRFERVHRATSREHRAEVRAERAGLRRPRRPAAPSSIASRSIVLGRRPAGARRRRRSAGRARARAACARRARSARRRGARAASGRPGVLIASVCASTIASSRSARGDLSLEMGDQLGHEAPFESRLRRGRSCGRSASRRRILARAIES